jgi:glycine hydroxymethyltransferase
VHPDTHLIDYDQVEKLAIEHKPKLIIAGASAYSRIIDFERFASIAKKVGAYFMADIAHIAGLVAAGVHPNPFPHADVVTSTTHKTLRGPRGGLIMCKKELADLIDRAIIPGTQGGPFMHIIAGKAIAFELASRDDFKDYQKLVVALAQAMVAEFKTLDYKIIADGTDNHLFVLDLRNKNITGRDAEVALEKAGIVVSRSCIPNDPQRPWITSGIRIGTPSIATRGMSVADALEIVHLIDAVIKNANDDVALSQIRKQVEKLCS